MNSRLTRSALLLPAIVIGLSPLTGLGFWLLVPLVINHGLYLLGTAGLLNLPHGEGLSTTLRFRFLPTFLVLGILIAPAFLMIGIPLLMIRNGAHGIFFLIAAASGLLYVGLTTPFWMTYGLTATWRRALRKYDGWLSPAKRSTMLASDYSLKSIGRALASIPVVGLFLGLCGYLWWILDGRADPQTRYFATLIYAFAAAPIVHLLIAGYTHIIFRGHDAAERQRNKAQKPESKPVGQLRGPGTQDPNRALLDAIQQKRITSVERLIELGANVNAIVIGPDGENRLALIEACEAGQSAIASMLLGAGADPNRAAAGKSPLHGAAQSGNPDVIRLLLEHGARPSAADGSGGTPMHFAAESNVEASVDLLAEFHADLEAMDQRHLTPLSLACQLGNWAASEALIRAGANIHPDQGHLPLYEAAGAPEDDTRGTEMLIQLGADPGRTGLLGRAPLMAAALAGNPRIADMLLRAGADIDARDQFGISALMEAARGGSDQVLQNMVFWQPQTEFTDKTGRTALLVAISSRKANLETVELLLQLGANAGARMRDGTSAEALANKHDRPEVAALLTSAGTSEPQRIDDAPKPAEPRTSETSTPASPARKASSSETVGATGGANTERLTSRPASSVKPSLVKDVATRLAEAAQADDLETCAQILDEYGTLPRATLQIAFLKAAEGDAKLVPSILLDEGLGANDHGDDGTPLISLTGRIDPPPLHALRALVERGASLDPTSDNDSSPLITWLLSAPSALEEDGEPDDDGQRALTELVLAAAKAGVDPDARDSSGRLALSWALERHSVNVIQALLEAGADPNRTGLGGETPLMEACRSQRADAANLVRLLSKFGGDPHHKGANDTSAFRVAMQSGNQTLLTFLMAGTGAKTDEAATLISAAQEGDTQRVTQLIDAGMEIDTADGLGRTALHHAAQGGHYRLVEKLVRLGASVDACADDDMTPLGFAVATEQADIVRLLTLAGADVSRSQSLGRSPLIMASAAWDSAMVDLLLELGAKVNERDRAENTALMCSVKAVLDRPSTSDATATVRVLLSAGADVNAVNDDLQSALMIVVGIQAASVEGIDESAIVSCVRTLIDAGANVLARDVSGWTPLHAAAAHGLADVIDVLLDANSDPKALDINGNAAADVAFDAGHSETAKRLTASEKTVRTSPSDAPAPRARG